MPGKQVKVDILRALNRIGAIQFGAFKLTSGRISPYYIDLRVVPSFPDVFKEICEYYTEFIKAEIGQSKFERIAGIPIAGMPFASTIAYNLRKPFLYVRRGVKLHGRQRRIEGILAPGDHILLVDDLVTTGLSLRKAAKALVAEGGVVSDAVVLIDRQEGGKQRLEKEGIQLYSPLTMAEVAKTLRELGTIGDDELKTIMKQIKKK